MISIRVLSSGCANCKRLEQVARQSVAALNINATIEKVTDVREIMKYHVLATPGLVVDEHVVCSGRVPSVEEVSAWLRVVPSAT